tara:strand:+ start:168 stop:662 length:495 start_codon:yes stop_codon:yes gene_type:complete
MIETKFVSEHSDIHQKFLFSAIEEGLQAIVKVGDSESKFIAEKSVEVLHCLRKISNASEICVTSETSEKSSKSQSKKMRRKTVKRDKRSKKSVELVIPQQNGAVENVNGTFSSNRLLQWRTKEALSQKKAAAKVKVSVSSWQAWEAGKWVPSAKTVQRLKKMGV